MPISRRRFMSSLVMSGLWAAQSLNHVHAAARSAEERAQRRAVEHGFSGYPLTMSSGVPSAAWSAVPGETVHFALSAEHTIKPHLHMQSISGEIVHTFGETLIEPQAYLTQTPWLDGAGFAPTVAWTIPDDLPSGVYFVNGSPDLFVTVRTAAHRSGNHRAHTIVTAILLPTNTINAYSTTEGRSTYAHPTRVPVVNFMRPFTASREQSWLGSTRWLNEEPLFGAPRYFIDQDLEHPDALQDVELLVIAGHSEYWTRRAREHFDAFVARGGHVIVASGNVMWWQVRYQGSGQQMVSYKDYDPQYGQDPVGEPLLVTRSWYNRELDMPIAKSIGGDFERGGFGSHRAGLGVQGTGLRVADPVHPLFVGLGLNPCETLDFGGVREYDGAPIVGLDVHGLPVADKRAIGAHRLEILAYEWTQRGGVTLATAHLYQARPGSGVVLHLGAPEAINGDAPGCHVMRQVCHDFARRVLSGESPFADREPAEVIFTMHTPWKKSVPPIEGRCGNLQPT